MSTNENDIDPDAPQVTLEAAEVSDKTQEAPTWVALARILGVSKVALHGWRKKDGAPANSLQIAAWQRFVKQNRLKEPLDSENAPLPNQLPGKCSYDALVRTGKMGYAQALEREQVVAREIANDKAREELDQLRKQSFTLQEVKDLQRRMAAVVHAALAELPKLACASFDVKMGPELKIAAKGWIADIKAAIAASEGNALS